MAEVKEQTPSLRITVMEIGLFYTHGSAPSHMAVLMETKPLDAIMIILYNCLSDFFLFIS